MGVRQGCQGLESPTERAAHCTRLIAGDGLAEESAVSSANYVIAAPECGYLTVRSWPTPDSGAITAVTDCSRAINEQYQRHSTPSVTVAGRAATSAPHCCPKGCGNGICEWQARQRADRDGPAKRRDWGAWRLSARTKLQTQTPAHLDARNAVKSAYQWLRHEFLGSTKGFSEPVPSQHGCLPEVATSEQYQVLTRAALRS